MPSYRLYFHNEDGYFARAENIDVSDDEVALSEARALNHRHCVEVWCEDRKVGMVQPPRRRREPG